MTIEILKAGLALLRDEYIDHLRAALVHAELRIRLAIRLVAKERPLSPTQVSFRL